MKSKKKIIIPITILILIIILSVYLYLNDYYKPTSDVNIYLKNNNLVKVEKIDKDYYFDGPGTNDIFIFYPGGKVKKESYAPLLNKLAENGIDCYLVDMPFNLAILNINAANRVINNYQYESWYIGGHSLGGATASMYLSKKDKLSGLILLAAYPTKKINNNIKVLSIYGTEDGVLNLEKYNKNKKYWNDLTQEIIIEGANHAQYGNYGHQKKDNKATITREEQQQKTIDAIINFIK